VRTRQQFLDMVAQGRIIETFLLNHYPQYQLQISPSPSGMPEGFAVCHQNGEIVWAGPNPPQIGEITPLLSGDGK